MEKKKQKGQRWKERKEPNVTERTHKNWEISGMTEGVLVLRFGAVDVLEGWTATLLEVICVDYRGRVQRTTSPCNLPP